MSKRKWPKYNQDLVKRGSVTFFIDQEALLHLLLILKIQYRLSYRALEGFSKSVLPFMDPSVTLPTYSLLCRRASDSPSP